MKEGFVNFKRDILNEVNVKIDNLLKTVTTMNQPQPKPHHPSQKVTQKKKVLFVGDSLSRNLNVSVLKNVTDMDIHREEAFIIGNSDPKARYPQKNFTDIVPKELRKIVTQH